MAPRPPPLSLADITDTSSYRFSDDPSKAHTVQQATGSICNVTDLSPVLIRLLDTNEKHTTAFVEDVRRLLDRGMPPACVLLNPPGDGNCLMYALVFTLGSATIQENHARIFVDRKIGGVTQKKVATSLRRSIQALASNVWRGNVVPPSFIFFDLKTDDFEIAVYQRLKVMPDDFPVVAAEIYNKKIDYNSNQNQPSDLAVEDKVFVRMFAVKFKVDVVVHQLHTNEPKENNTDPTTGWSTHIFYKDGSAMAITRMVVEFTVLDWSQFPRQIILYDTEPPGSPGFDDKKKAHKRSKKKKQI